MQNGGHYPWTVARMPLGRSWCKQQPRATTMPCPQCPATPLPPTLTICNAMRRLPPLTKAIRIAISFREALPWSGWFSSFSTTTTQPTSKAPASDEKNAFYIEPIMVAQTLWKVKWLFAIDVLINSIALNTRFRARYTLFSFQKIPVLQWYQSCCYWCCWSAWEGSRYHRNRNHCDYPPPPPSQSSL